MYTDNHGLLTVNREGISEENSFLWTVELLVIQKKKGLDYSKTIGVIESALEKMHLGNGVYKQAPHLDPDPENKDTYMSHDQLTAILVYFKITNQHNKIREIISNFRYGISYNNVDNSFRFFHPRDLIFYYLLNNRKLALLFLPLLWLITIETFFSEYKVRGGVKIPKTDGEILYYIKRESSDCFRAIDAYCEHRVKQRFGTWDNLFKVYFKPALHPINLIKEK